MLIDSYDVEKFERNIKQLLNEDNNARPFLCEGLPFECDIFLVGINPATTTNFWKYWTQEYGCDKQAWLEEYKKNHNGKLGKTRNYIEMFFQSIKPLKVLETNIYPFASDREADLDSKYKQTDLFEFLVETIKPKVIVGHGASTIKQLSKMYKTDLVKGQYIKIDKADWNLTIRVENHFSYQWSKNGIKNLAEDVKAYCLNNIKNSKQT